MKCEEVKLNLPAYIDGKLDDKTMAEIGRHLESCADCS
jgi:anti-sigma factor RsiW